VIEHLEFSSDDEIVLTICGSDDSCHSEFVVAELWNGDRFIHRLGGATRKTVAGEIGDERMIDLYYDPETKVDPDSLLRIIQSWKAEWLAYGLVHRTKIRVDESLHKAEHHLTQLSNCDFPR
jgi:hypothetical protein